MRYAIRALKYFLFLCVLYVAIMWLMALDSRAADLDVVTLLKMQLCSDNGVLLVVAFVLLAALYPRFGYMRRRVADCDIARDAQRITNAMQHYGFKLDRADGNVLFFRAEGVVKRLLFMFEDEIRVQQCDGGIEIAGIRRAVARIAYQLEAYLASRRFEDNE